MRAERWKTWQRGAAVIVAAAAVSLFGACGLGGGKSDEPAPPATGAAAATARTFTMPGQASQTASAKPGAAATPGVATPKPPCQPCASQEDFDEAQRKGRSCCAAQSCVADAGCSGGRVCCKIPGGTLCTDAGRCAAGDRVKGASKTPHGACRVASDCPDGDLCCDTGAGPGKPGKCMGISDGIKGCQAPP